MGSTATVYFEEDVRLEAHDSLDVERVLAYTDMSGAYTKTGRRPNQRTFRERLAFPYSMGRLDMPLAKPEVIDSGEYFRAPDEDEWSPLIGVREFHPVAVAPGNTKPLLLVSGAKEVVPA